MIYQHRFKNGEPCDFPVGKVVCVGRNYSEHALELNNPIPTKPLLFIKPATSLVDFSPTFNIPKDKGEVHHELEVALLIGQPLQNATPNMAAAAIAGIGLSLDLTLRDLQSELKKKSHPWEIAKSFDGACPTSPFISPSEISDSQNIDFELIKNGQLQQVGNTKDMLFSIGTLLVAISRNFSLMPGDIVLTGTPAGVGPLKGGDELAAKLGSQLVIQATVA